MKIYTRTGDDGTTGLFGGWRLPKHHPRIEAYGTVDELNSVIGVARSMLSMPPVAPTALVELDGWLVAVQGDLFVMGSDLSGASASTSPSIDASAFVLKDEAPARLEAQIDSAEAALEPLRNFILPAGTPAAASLHLARTVCRRAERTLLRLVELLRDEPASAPRETRGTPLGLDVDPLPAPSRVNLVYLNRLSDACFVWARLANAKAGVADVPWND